MITITHPTVTEGTVVASGLTFVSGKAEVASFDDPAAVAVLTEHGFTFDGEPEKADDQTGTIEIVGTKLEKLSRAEVDAIAAEHGIDISAAKNKTEAIALIDASGKIPVLGADDSTDDNSEDDSTSSDSDETAGTDSSDASAS